MPQTWMITGANRGIGLAITIALLRRGDRVIAAARNPWGGALAELAGVHVGQLTPLELDVTSDESVAAAKRALAGRPLDVLVNNAGGALGLEPVHEGDIVKWRRMYEINVIGTLQVTKALLPALEATGAGIVVNVGSIAGRTAYEGGGGYTAAKHALAVMTETLRLELWDRPVRITEIAPGMVQTEGFSLVRFGGDKERADKVYEGVKGPLVAEDIADAIVWMATRPAHVNVDLLVIKPRAQAAPHKVDRER